MCVKSSIIRHWISLITRLVCHDNTIPLSLYDSVTVYLLHNPLSVIDYPCSTVLFCIYRQLVLRKCVRITSNPPHQFIVGYHLTTADEILISFTWSMASIPGYFTMILKTTPEPTRQVFPGTESGLTPTPTSASFSQSQTCECSFFYRFNLS